jgi:hypothetical protein
VAGTAILAAGGAFSTQVFHALDHASPLRHHHPAHAARQLSPHTRTIVPAAARTGSVPVENTTAKAGRRDQRLPVHGPPKPPSKSLGYLAVGGPATGATSGSSSETSTREPSARAASVASSASDAEEGAPVPPEGSPPPPTQSGGGTSLGYLGH